MGNNNSPRRCMNLCNTQRFKYAAIKRYLNYNLIIKIIYKYFFFFSNTCECRNYEPKFNLKRRDNDCITVCKENLSERCGGGTTVVSIYKTLYPGKNEYNINLIPDHNNY